MLSFNQGTRESIVVAWDYIPVPRLTYNHAQNAHHFGGKGHSAFDIDGAFMCKMWRNQ